MVLDFDVDDGPSFQELVQSGRDDVLKGRTTAQCWRDLADQYPLFKDIAKEGRLRGATLGVVLAALEGISRVVKQAEVANASQTETPEKVSVSSSSSPLAASAATASTNGTSILVAEGEVHNAEALMRVVDAYMGLYSSTPVPTRAQWLEAMREAKATVATFTGIGAGNNSTLYVFSSSTVGGYLSELHTTLESVAQMIADNDDTEGEDGSFAEEELKKCVHCCVVAGRKAARHTTRLKAGGKVVREMMRALQDYAGNSTLEW